VQDKRDDTQDEEAKTPDTVEQAERPDTAGTAPAPETDGDTAPPSDTAPAPGDGASPQDTPGAAAGQEPAPLSDPGPAPDTASGDTAGDGAGSAPDDAEPTSAGAAPATNPGAATAPPTPDPASEPQDTPGDPPPDPPPEAEAGAGPQAPDVPPEPDPGPEPEQQPQPAPGIFAAPAPEAEPSGPPCAAGLFGKLPARGDFISRAIAQDLLRPFEDWLLPLVQNTRALLGDDWGQAWRQAPPWRFWIGPDVLRGEWTRNLRAHEQAGTVTGVLLPSADRQGRLFPLVLVLADDHARLMPPPVLEPPDRRWYAACDRLLHTAREGATLETVETSLARLSAPRLPDDAAQMAQLLAQRSLWGQGAGLAGPEGHDDVWTGIRASDHHLAATGRSYWWCEAPRGETSVISLAGLPDPETFAFMLTDAIPRTMSQTGA